MLLLCLQRKLSAGVGDSANFDYVMWVCFYIPLACVVGYTRYVSNVAEKALNDGLRFSNSARNHVITSNRRFVLVNIGLWVMIGVPTVMVFMAPVRCVETSTLSVYGIMLGIRGLVNLCLWTICIPGLWEMVKLSALIWKIKLSNTFGAAYTKFCPCLAGPGNHQDEIELPDGMVSLLRAYDESEHGADGERDSEKSFTDRVSESFSAIHKEIVEHQSEADFFLRAEVIWLVSWGSLFNLAKHFQPRPSNRPADLCVWDTDILLWPENSAVEVPTPNTLCFSSPMKIDCCYPLTDTVSLPRVPHAIHYCYPSLLSRMICLRR